MPSAATTDQKNKSRLPGQASKLYFAARLPNIIYTAQLSAPPASNNQIAEISFGSGAGTLANVKADMKLLVGTSAGGDELGEARIRKAPIAGTFYIGECSEIDWLYGGTIYLTVVDDFDMRAKHLRMDGTTPKMDYDISYSNQHSVFNPIPVLGPIVRVKKLTGANVVVQLGPEAIHASSVFGSSIASYLWSCSTAVSFSSTSAVRPTATFNTTGWHVVYCLVTSAAGAAKIGVRYVYIWNDEDPPLTVFDIEDCTEEFQDGGIRFSVSVQEQVNLSSIPRRALAVLFTEDYYGISDEQQQISIGHVVDAENIIAVGRIANESSSFDAVSGISTFEVEGYHSLLKKISGFPVGVEITGTSSAWTNMAGLTVDRGLWHLLEWRSTATTIMDVILTGDTRYTKEISSPSTNLWAQIEDIAFSQILANTHVDHMGRLFVEIDPLLTPEADRDYPIIMELEKQDLTGKVQFDEQIIEKVGQISLSGLNVTLGGSGIAYFSLSPGNVFGQFGGVEPIDKLLLESQVKANQLAGLVYAARNNDLQIRIKLNHNNRLITCFPNQSVTITVDAADNPRGVSFTKNFIPRRRKLSIDKDTGFLQTELELEAETEEMISTDGIIPGSDDFSLPPVPPFNPIPINLPSPLPGGGGSINDNGPKKVLVYDTSDGLFLTENFDAGENEQTWYSVNGGLTVTEYQNIRRILKAPNGAIYVMGGYPGVVDHFLKRAAYAGAMFETIEDQASINAKLGTTGQNGGIGTFNFNPLLSEYVAYTLCNITENANAKVYRGNYPTFTLGVTIGVSDPRVGDISYGNGKWIFTGNGLNAKFFRLDSALTTIETSDALDYFAQHRHKRISTTGDVYHWHGDNFTISKSSDNCASFVDDIGAGYIADPNGGIASDFAIDPTGQYIMTLRSGTGKGKSSDFGATLLDVSNLPATGNNWIFAHAGGTEDPLRWVAASGGGYIYYSDDFFATAPMDKRGNILSLVSILTCRDIIIIEE